MSYKYNKPMSSTYRCQTNKCVTPDCADFDILPPLNLTNLSSDYNTIPLEEIENPNSQWTQREWLLSRQLSEAETKLECFKDKLMKVVVERNRLLDENSSANENIKNLDIELANVSQELRQYKFKEVRLLSYYNVLEEENANLHKQLSDMRKQQVDSEIKNRQEIESVRKKQKNGNGKSDEDPGQDSSDMELLEEEVARLKILTVTKGEQLTTLREVLTSTKKTFEESIKNMKIKFETEKSAMIQEIKDLKNEVKILRDKTGNGGSETITQQQYEELLRQFEECEKEKRTLMQMLYTAQEQKLTLSRKLENGKNKSKRNNNS